MTTVQALLDLCTDETWIHRNYDHPGFTNGHLVQAESHWYWIESDGDIVDLGRHWETREQVLAALNLASRWYRGGIDRGRKQVQNALKFHLGLEE